MLISFWKTIYYCERFRSNYVLSLFKIQNTPMGGHYTAYQTVLKRLSDLTRQK